MYKVLVVEDSLTVRKIVNKLIEDNPHFTCDLCEDLAEAKSALESDTEYLAALSLHFPTTFQPSYLLGISTNLPVLSYSIRAYWITLQKSLAIHTFKCLNL